MRAQGPRWLALCPAALLALSGCAAAPPPGARVPAPAASSAPECTAPVCSFLEPRGLDQVLVVENRAPVVVSVEVAYDVLENAMPTRPAPLRQEVAAGARAELVGFRTLDPRTPGDVRTRVSIVFGSARTVPDETVRYAMPFGGDVPRCVGQGMEGGITHVGPFRFAIDFDMPEGTPVVAAREGVVLLAEDGHGPGGPDPRFLREVNRVVIAHADGTLARYVHLRKGLAVKPGQRVAAGQRLGDSGSSGQASAPHLHFDVGILEAEAEGFSIPVRFGDAAGEGITPARGACYPPAG